MKQPPPGALGDINETWMKTIHGEENGTQPAKSGTDTEEKETDSIVLPNPVPEKPETPETPVTNPGESQSLFGNREEGPSFFSVFLRFLGFGALLLLFFVGTMRWIKRRNLLPTMFESDLLQVIARIPLMPGKTLQIVDLAGQILVLGVSDQSMDLILEVKNGELADRIRLWHSQKSVLTQKESVLDQLTSLVRGSRFWQEKPGKTDFAALLGGNNGAEVTEDLGRLLAAQKERLRSRKQNQPQTES
ncbi:MAG: flagellar biosynthetic protein FliO [Spirochaetales bacterium]|nr:flagellar biosynthetic protein FliO [Spirochaetales bacterium]